MSSTLLPGVLFVTTSATLLWLSRRALSSPKPASPKPAPPIRYTSTRLKQDKTFEEAVLLGLANDGGLFIPKSIPKVSPAELAEWSKLKSYPALALEVFKKFVPGDACTESELRGLVNKSYGKQFRSDHVVPTVRLKKTGVELLELFHGPTFAFKDVALQFLGNLFEHLLARKQGEEAKITVLGATSGDTGSSAIYGLAGKAGIECFILFPEGRVSPIQERQMTTVQDKNVHCVSIRGTFDDAQDIVKASFKDEAFRSKYRLAAVNSINWARIMAQITYYFYSYFRVMEQTKKLKIAFVVPTGNFGDILAGYYAKRMGLPVYKFVVATNENDILDRFFKSGTYERRNVKPTITPSMDICVSSNFERFMYHMMGEDDKKTAELMNNFEATGSFTLPPDAFARCKAEMCSVMVTEDGIRKVTNDVVKNDDYLLDPHTAIGVEAGRLLSKSLEFKDCEMVCLATAHWAKFVDAVESAVGLDKTSEWVKDRFPQELEKLKTLPVRKTIIDAELPVVKKFINDTLGR